MSKRSNDKRVLQFLKLLKKSEVIEAVGIARLLQVPLVICLDDEESGSEISSKVVERDYDSILADLIDAFAAETKSKQKFILNLMRMAIED